MDKLQAKSEKQYYIPMEVNETSKEWQISTTPALDNPQADRYYPDSRMTLSIKYRKKRCILWN